MEFFYCPTCLRCFTNEDVEYIYEEKCTEYSSNLKFNREKRSTYYRNVRKQRKSFNKNDKKCLYKHIWRLYKEKHLPIIQARNIIAKETELTKNFVYIALQEGLKKRIIEDIDGRSENKYEISQEIIEKLLKKIHFHNLFANRTLKFKSSLQQYYENIQYETIQNSFKENNIKHYKELTDRVVFYQSILYEIYVYMNELFFIDDSSKENILTFNLYSIGASESLIEKLIQKKSIKDTKKKSRKNISTKLANIKAYARLHYKLNLPDKFVSFTYDKNEDKFFEMKHKLDNKLLLLCEYGCNNILEYILKLLFEKYITEEIRIHNKTRTVFFQSLKWSTVYSPINLLDYERYIYDIKDKKYKEPHDDKNLFFDIPTSLLDKIFKTAEYSNRDKISNIRYRNKNFKNRKDFYLSLIDAFKKRSTFLKIEKSFIDIKIKKYYEV